MVHNALASRVVVNQLTPLLPKDSEEVNLHVKRLHVMLDAATMMAQSYTQESGGKVRTPTIARVRVGTRLVAYQPPCWSTTRVRAERP
jgi:hypothetical protein